MSSSRKTSLKSPQTRPQPAVGAASAGPVQTQEIDALGRLHTLMTRLLELRKLPRALEEILDASIDLLHADFGLVQVYQHDINRLVLFGQRGFNSDFLDMFKVVAPDAHSACARSLQTRARVIIEDAASDPLFASCRNIIRNAGFLAVQSTPLIGTGGQLLGVLSTHFRKSHRPSDYELRVLDLYARLAADVIERLRTEQALKDADQRKDEFIATLAHELRNPLMPLGVAAEILNNNPGGGGHSPEVAQIVKRQVDNLTRLVDDLLEISRITLGKIELRKTAIDLRVIIENSIEISRPHIQQARHRLEVVLPDEAVMLQVDPLRVTQIIANLLNNAAKYTPDGGEISLRAAVENEQVVIRMRDNGIGIPAEQLPHIFDLLAQPSQRAQSMQSGIGIGLSLARTLAELHGGTLSAVSEGVNRGSELILRIPYQGVTIETPPVLPVAEASDTVSKAFRILIADDNRGAADIMAIALRGMRARVRVVYDGAAAVATAMEFKPHIVFMDIGMSGVDGHEAARRIRAQPQNKDIVLIAVSGWGQDEDRSRSLEAGFNHHAVKPLGLQELRRLVQEYAQFRARER